MDRVGSPRGLIRYTSQDALAGKRPKLLRLRTVAYPTLLIGLITSFVLVLSTKYAFDARLVRGAGNPFPFFQLFDEAMAPDGEMWDSHRGSSEPMR